MCQLSVSVGNLIFLKLVFAGGVNSWARATRDYHKNWATMNSNDSTVHVDINESWLKKERFKNNGKTVLESVFQFFFKASFTNDGDREWYNVLIQKTGMPL